MSKKIRPGRYPQRFWWRSANTGLSTWTYNYYQDCLLTFRNPKKSPPTTPKEGYEGIYEAEQTVYLGGFNKLEFHGQYPAVRLAKQYEIIAQHPDLIAFEWIEPPYRHKVGNPT